MSEARITRLDDEIRDIKAALARLEPLIIRIDATLPHLATKEELADLALELADKPGRVFLATAIGVLIAAYALGLAGLAALPIVAKLVR